MSNTGLKDYNKFLDYKIGGLEIKINLSNVNKNLLFISPLTLQIGKMPLDVSIIYNDLCKNDIEYFGKGIRSTLYKKINEISNDIWQVENPDFTVDTFNKIANFQYLNYENRNVIRKEYISSEYNYKLYDKEENVIIYRTNTNNYYENVNIKGRISENASYSFPNYIIYTNAYNDNLTLNITNNRINNCYYRDSNSSDILFETELIYDNQNRLEEIKIKKGNDYLRDESIIYGNNSYTFIDNISGNKIIITINTNSTVVEEYFTTNLIGTTTINYYSNKTKVINSLGQKVIYFFSTEGLLLTELEDNMANGYIYNKTFKAPTLITNEFRIKNIETSVFKPSLSDFTTSCTISDYTTTIDYDLNEIVTNAKKLEGNGNSYLYYPNNNNDNSPTIGTSNDYYTFLVWVKEISVNENAQAYIELMINSDVRRTYINDLAVGNEFRLISVGIRPNKSFTKLRMLIYINGCNLAFGGIQLIKRGFGTSYEYDELGNIIKQIDKLGTNSYTYNSNNKLISVSDYVGNIRNIEYNTNSQISYNMSRYGVIEKNEYDSSVMYNLTKKTYKTLTETFGEEYYYLSGKDLLKTKDIFSNETFYDYDTFKNISNILRLNLDVKEFNYNNKNLLSSIIRNPDDNYEVCSYTYDELRRISAITTASNSIYEFVYDGYNNLTKVLLDDEELMELEYDNNHMGVEVTYSNGDNYVITYSNNYKVIDTLTFNGNTYEFSYDPELRLIGIDNSVIAKTFTYDLDGKIINQTINDLNLEYKYQLDNINMIIENIQNNKFIQIYKDKSEDLGKNPLMLEKYVMENSNMFIATYSNVIINSNEQEINYYARNKNNIILPNFEQGMGNYPFTTIVGGINAYEPGKNGQYISYTTTSSASSDQMISVGAWIKPTNITNPYIFMIRRGTTIKPVIYIKIVNGVVKVDYEKESGSIETLISSANLITTNNWHYVAFRYFKDYVEEDDYGYDIYCFELYIGMKKYTFYHTNSDYNFYNQTNLKYHLGYRMINGYVNNAFTGYMTGIIMGNGTYVSESFIKNYYLESFESMIKISTTTASIDYSTHTYYINSGNYSLDEIIPLRGNYGSLNGSKLEKLDLPNTVEEYKESSFIYNELINSYAYTPKSLLCYRKDFGNQGAIILKMITYDTLVKEEIIEINNNNGKIELFIENDYLNINLFGNSYNTYHSVSKNVWHRVGISYSYSSSTISLRVFFDGYTVTRTKSLSTFDSDLKIYIGSSCSNDNATNILFGQIVDLYLKSSYITQTTFQNICGSIFGVSKALEYDSLGRKINDVINYNSSTNFEVSHTYDKMRVISDNFGNNIRSYNYNTRNYISSITDSTYGSHTYTYDDRGYLSSDNDINYTYDGNGNILSVGSTQFTYDSTYKDRLNSVGGYNITYDSNNPYYPTSYKNMSFTYEGRRLKKVTLPSKEIEFYYDDEGIRYKKTVKENNVLTKTILYYYDNKKLICEIDGNIKRNYLYDNEGSIYGFVEGELSYYYIKDSLGIIHGIRNLSGQTVATYIYDAYGNITSSTSTFINNIRYKGYYYDEEINMYYLLSRYYYPEFRRFLTPDNYTYLELGNINDLNLFAYCNNNPVMYSDGEGTFAILALALIGALVITGSIIEGNVEYEKWKKNGDIDIKADYVEIKKSWLIQNPIASLVFTLRLTNSKEYKDIYNDNNPSKRNWFDMWLEWEGHNIVGNISASLIPIVAIPEFLLSNQIGTLGLIYTFRRCYDVYMENSEDWWKVWKHKK